MVTRFTSLRDWRDICYKISMLSDKSFLVPIWFGDTRLITYIESSATSGACVEVIDSAWTHGPSRGVR